MELFEENLMCPEKGGGNGRGILHQCLCTDVLQSLHHPKDYTSPFT